MFKHLNNNVLCTVTIQTSGEDYTEHDIIQLCICPMDHRLYVDPDPRMRPFIINLRPRRFCFDSEYIKENKYNEIIQHGVDPFDAIDALVKWFEYIRLRQNKKIMPLAFNWPFVSSFLKDWLMADFDYIFDHQYRDLLSFATLLNDRNIYNLMQSVPYPKTRLSYLASQCKIDYNKNYDIMRQAIAIMKVYKHMLGVFAWHNN